MTSSCFYRISFAIVLLGLLFAGQSNAEPKTVRLLTVGNSFAGNALSYLDEITEAGGHRLIVGQANLGGCTLERHWKHVALHEADPSDRQGAPYRGNRSLDDLLTTEDWDFITLQQVSFRSHDLESYYPYARDLYDYIRERSTGSRIMAHQTWAYRVDDPRFTAENEREEPHSHREMYEQVRAAYHQFAEDLDLEILPSGDAMFLADTDPEWGYRPDESFDFKSAEYPQLPKQLHSLHTGWSWKKNRDGKHVLNLDGHHANRSGQFLLGCVWFEVLFEESVLENNFVPEGMDADYAAFLRRTAHRAVAELKAEQKAVPSK